jgi:hypothetical protein
MNSWILFLILQKLVAVCQDISTFSIFIFISVLPLCIFFNSYFLWPHESIWASITLATVNSTRHIVDVTLALTHFSYSCWNLHEALKAIREEHWLHLLSIRVLFQTRLQSTQLLFLSGNIWVTKIHLYLLYFLVFFSDCWGMGNWRNVIINLILQLSCLLLFCLDILIKDVNWFPLV